MPRKNKRATGCREVLDLKTENDFKYQSLSTPEPIRLDTKKGTILRSSQLSS